MIADVRERLARRVKREDFIRSPACLKKSTCVDVLMLMLLTSNYAFRPMLLRILGVALRENGQLVESVRSLEDAIQAAVE